MPDNTWVPTSPIFPFDKRDIERVVLHPETPSSYVEWREILPFINVERRPYFGNLLSWSYPLSRKTIGASRAIFKKIFKGIGEDELDDWMFSLSETPINDFIDHHIPFLQNITELVQSYPANEIIAKYLEAYNESKLGTQIDLPSNVLIETTKSCNFSCSMCSSRTKGFKQDRTLALEDFGEIIHVLGPHAKTIRINGYGETTIIPDIVQYLDCLDEFNFNGIREVITNFSAPLNVYKELVKRNFLIIVSWDATEPPLFESIRHGADYLKMYDNLKVIGRELAEEPERLVILSTIQKKNIKEIVPIAKLASNVGVGMVIYNMVKEDDGSPWMNEKYDEIRENFSIAEEIASKLGIKLKIPDHIGSKLVGQLLTTQTSMTFCNRPYSEILIHWDTELTVCNMFNPYSYGTLKHSILPPEKQNMEKRFRILWNGPNAKLFRSIINKQTVVPYCKQCYFM